MKMVSRGTGEINKRRGLISGFSKSGKTKSIETFIEEGKSTVILLCPGEAGLVSLPEDSDLVTSYYIETEEGEDITNVEWSREAIFQFNKMYSEIEKNKPDKLFIDGLHHLYSHDFNSITGGEYLAGLDLNVGKGGKFDPYRSARFYSQGHMVFGQRIAGFYASQIPFLCCTVWEEWQSAKVEQQRDGGIQSTRYLWPALPGAMATQVVGRFDFRLSARLEKRCIHTNCEESKNDNLHYVWQFAPKDDVMGVGINGLHVTQGMMQKPWIHQTWSALQNLMKRVS